MTIFKVDSNFIYFSHIPRCAGSSIEDYLANCPECSTQFLDRDYYGGPLRKWTKSSPQHIPGNVIERLFDVSFFSYHFALIRNPIDRFKSAFNFQKYWAKNISEEIDCNYFVNELLANNYKKQGWCDNHFQTQISFLIPSRRYKLFLMNHEGIINVKKYIDQIVFEKDSEIDFPRNNTSKQLYFKKMEEVDLNSKSIAVIEKIYQLDINLFEVLNNKNFSLQKGYFIFKENNFEVLENEDIKIENEDIKVENRNLKLENKILNLENKIINLEKENLKLENKDIKKENEDFKSEKEDIKLENENIKLEKENIKSENEKIKLENEDIKLEKENIKLEKENIKLENEDIKSENEKIKLENEDIKLEKDNLKLENENIKLEKENLKSENENIKLENEDIKLEKENIKLENDDIKLEKENLKLENEELKIKNESINIKNESLNKESDELKNILLSIQESRIWRYSYQFRKIMDNLRNSKN